LLAGVVHAQDTYTSIPGKTTIYGNYDPNAPAPKAPVVPEPSAVQKQILTAVKDYEARQAEIAQYSQSTFVGPPRVEVTGGGGPLPRTPEAKAPVASAPAPSFEALTYTGFNPPSRDIAGGPSDIVMGVN